MDIQLKRGLLEVCVLAAIRNEDSYGYKIIKDMSPYLEMSESTLYTILKRLESGKLLTVWSAEHGGRLRKYYRITSEGKDRIEEFKDDWKEIESIYRFITRETSENVTSDSATPENVTFGNEISDSNPVGNESATPQIEQKNELPADPFGIGFDGPDVNRFSFGPEDNQKGIFRLESENLNSKE